MKLCIVPQLEKLQPFVILQHDCTHPLKSTRNNVWTFLDETFAERWISHGGLISCHLFSPRVTLLSVLLWQYVKDYVFRTSVGDIATLLVRIIETI
jgi:hypothetical protein